MLLGLDFETYSDVDLRKHGLDRYISSPYFTPLIAVVVSLGREDRFNFVDAPSRATHELARVLEGNTVACHNRGFEAAVLEWLDIPLPSMNDSAVMARHGGFNERLESAGPQILQTPKLDEQRNLIRLFCVPHEETYNADSPAFNDQVITDHKSEWDDFWEYCARDAKLSLEIASVAGLSLRNDEWRYEQLTFEMNKLGWPVDMKLVEAMQNQYLANMTLAEKLFRDATGAKDLNLNSYPQVKQWCADRGIKANSFDEKSVARLRKRIEARLAKSGLTTKQMAGYNEVLHLLITKQVLGGSALKKLQTIKDTVGEDGRLRDQYVHFGAGQTGRTTGRSVQMQNLKRLGGQPDPLDEVPLWNNETLARNMRQCFTSSDTAGALLVGDFASVESRGLAWQAGAVWKTDAFRNGLDMYKVMAQRIYPGLEYDAVSKQQRTTGKVGELSCGYGAGPEAVVSFAEGMGVELTEAEATQLVVDWREANPEIVAYWEELSNALLTVLNGHTYIVGLPDGWEVRFEKVPAPLSLQKEKQTHDSLCVVMVDAAGKTVFLRYFHGIYMRGRNMAFHKPSERKTGELWKDHYISPKDGRKKYYELYGGKLAGILTQSLCREIFFNVAQRLQNWADQYHNVEIIGQFHDELILDWTPMVAAETCVSLADAEIDMRRIMSQYHKLPVFPLAAEVHSDYRYIK